MFYFCGSPLLHTLHSLVVWKHCPLVFAFNGSVYVCSSLIDLNTAFVEMCVCVWVCVCAVVISLTTKNFRVHYDDVIMDAIASQITSLTIVYLTVYSERKNQSSASLTFVWGIHQGPVNSPHKGPVTRKMFPFDDVTMCRGPACKFIIQKDYSLVMDLSLLQERNGVSNHGNSTVCSRFKLTTKKTLKVFIIGSLWGQSTGDRCISLSKGR